MIDAVEKMRKAARGGFEGSKGFVLSNLETLFGVEGTHALALAIADAVEAEVAEKYVALPTCADGVIRIGCDIGNGYCRIGEIDAMQFDADGTWVVFHDGNGWEVTGDERFSDSPRSSLEETLHMFWTRWEELPIDLAWDERMRRLLELESDFAEKICEMFEEGE